MKKLLLFVLVCIASCWCGIASAQTAGSVNPEMIEGKYYADSVVVVVGESRTASDLDAGFVKRDWLLRSAETGTEIACKYCNVADFSKDAKQGWVAKHSGGAMVYRIMEAGKDGIILLHDNSMEGLEMGTWYFLSRK